MGLGSNRCACCGALAVARLIGLPFACHECADAGCGPTLAEDRDDIARCNNEVHEISRRPLRKIAVVAWILLLTIAAMLAFATVARAEPPVAMPAPVIVAPPPETPAPQTPAEEVARVVVQTVTAAQSPADREVTEACVKCATRLVTPWWKSPGGILATIGIVLAGGAQVAMQAVAVARPAAQ